MSEVLKRGPHRKRFRTNLKELREKRGMTQKQLADRVGIATAYYARIEQNYHQPGAIVLQKIAKVLRISPAKIKFIRIGEGG